MNNFECCKGCSTYLTSYYFCYIHASHCPCKKCLLKTVCTDKCEKFQTDIENKKIKIKKLLVQKNNNPCKGCRLTCICISEDISVKEKKNILSNCPCTQCLFKMICIDSCSKFLNYHPELIQSVRIKQLE